MTWQTDIENELSHQGVSMSEVSIKAGLGQNTLRSWLIDGKVPNFENLQAVLDVLGLQLIIIWKTKQ